MSKKLSYGINSFRFKVLTAVAYIYLYQLLIKYG